MILEVHANRWLALVNVITAISVIFNTVTTERERDCTKAENKKPNSSK